MESGFCVKTTFAILQTVKRYQTPRIALQDSLGTIGINMLRRIPIYT